MMGIQSGQIQMVILDIDSMIPENHLLRQIKNRVNFDFIYEKALPYYSTLGRKSIAPVVLVKMLLIGYLYGIKSERRLEEKVSLNLAYRWFAGLISCTKCQTIQPLVKTENDALKMLAYFEKFLMRLF